MRITCGYYVVILLGKIVSLVINPHNRYQKGLKMADLFPTPKDGTCSCGCGSLLTGRQTRWASSSCSDKLYESFAVLKGSASRIREQLFRIDKGFCRTCGVYDKDWEADHIIPVQFGGAGQSLDNFQTLCPDCHVHKTRNQLSYHRSLISSQLASNDFTIRLYPLGDVEYDFSKTPTDRQA